LLALPLFRQGFEANVLSENDATQLAGVFQQFVIFSAQPSSMAVITSTPRRRSWSAMGCGTCTSK
jgi:hypothetical protein